MPRGIGDGPRGQRRWDREAVTYVAQQHKIPYALSTMGTTSIEDVAAAGPEARKWFQLYVWRDRAAAEELMNRAATAGYEALMLTVDVPVAGARLRDVRNGFTIPPAPTRSCCPTTAVASSTGRRSRCGWSPMSWPVWATRQRCSWTPA